MLRLTRAIEFSSSLQYRRPELDAEANERLFGAASRPHGHNYRLEVTLKGQPDPVTGMVMDLKELKELLEREVTAPLGISAEVFYAASLPPSRCRMRPTTRSSR